MSNDQEIKIIKTTIPAHNHYYEVKNLKSHESYEAWITASTKLGSGPSTPVVKLLPSSQVPAQIISFGRIITVAWKNDVAMPCLAVGYPKPSTEWTVADEKAKKQMFDFDSDNTLVLRNVQRHHESNYSCYARNYLGSDRITYQLFVHVPPGKPKLTATSTSSSSSKEF